jgi:ferredoxin-thioredoxin reductase catalytic subunit
MNQWTTHPKDYEALLADTRRIAEANGCVLNPDGDRVAKVVGLMTENVVAVGKRFCPCKQSHPLDVEKDVLCPCPTWKDEISQDGHCFCRLFYAKPA